MSAKRRLIEAVEVTDAGIHIVRLMHVFDASSLDEFEKVLAYLLAHDNYRIVVDLANVEFISSAGWGAFTAELRRVRDNGGDIRLAGMNPDVLDVFLLLELDSFINAYDTIEDAILSFELPAHGPAEYPKPAANLSSLPEPQNTDSATSPAWLPRPGLGAADSDAHPNWEAHTTGTPVPLDAKQPAPAEEAEGHGAEADMDLGYSAADAPSLQDMLSGNANAFADYAEDLPPAEQEETTAAAHGIEIDAGSDVGLQAGARHEQPSRDFVQAPPAADDEAAMDPAVAPLPESRRQSQPSDIAEGTPAPAESFFEEYVLQDINDPWILDEIDRLPEEYEMDEVSWEDGPGFTDDSMPASPRRVEEPPAAPARIWAAVEDKAAALAPGERRADSSDRPVATRPAPARTAQAAVEAKPTEGWRPMYAAPRPAVSAGVGREGMPPAVAPIEQKRSPAKGPQPIRQSHAVSKMRFGGDGQSIVRQIVSQHPHYGPTMIQKYLEVRTEPAIMVSRSTVYRWLRQAGLNTREQRLQFAGRAALA